MLAELFDIVQGKGDLPLTYILGGLFHFSLTNYVVILLDNRREKYPVTSNDSGHR